MQHAGGCSTFCIVKANRSVYKIPGLNHKYKKSSYNYSAKAKFFLEVKNENHRRAQADFNLAEVEARWERVLCPTNTKKTPKMPSAFNVVNRSNCVKRMIIP